MTHTVTVDLPEEIYRRLEESAQATDRPMAEVVVQSVKAGRPPSVSDLPPEVREECVQLQRLSDKQLRRLAESTIRPGRQRLYTQLLRKNQAGTITGREQQQLTRLGSDARRTTLLKAYAYALLKWRGSRIPPAELRQPA